VLAYCTACGAQRFPLVAKSTNHAGKPRIIGGALTRVFGWIVLSGGVTLGLVLLGLLQAIFPAGFAGLVVGLPIIVISSMLGIALLRGGRSLESTGVAEQRETRESAVFSLADNKNGIVTAQDVAASFGMGVADADALLTTLAKERPDHVTLEVDDQGGIFYRVSARGLSRVQSFDEKLRVATMPQTESRTVDGTVAESVPTDVRTRTRA
jgi:hypothetical protein